MKKTISDIAQLLKSSKEEKKDSMFYAKVNSLITEGGEVKGYKVSLDGTANDTIEAKKIAGAKVGDVVQVNLHNGHASVTGTVGGDTDAKDAQDAAEVADGKATTANTNAGIAQARADSAYTIASNANNYFWTDNDGAHITTDVKQVVSGKANTLINAGGMAIRSGTTELAKFTDALIELGKNSASSVVSFCNNIFSITTSMDGNFRSVDMKTTTDANSKQIEIEASTTSCKALVVANATGGGNKNAHASLNASVTDSSINEAHISASTLPSIGKSQAYITADMVDISGTTVRIDNDYPIAYVTSFNASTGTLYLGGK